MDAPRAAKKPSCCALSPRKSTPPWTHWSSEPKLESALPKPRLIGETARTCGQLRLFAEVVEEGSWVSARIDRPDADRKPVPKPDLRSMLHPLGPVAIFGASNFPLAFSVAGGDTASALAAGNPVIVKGASGASRHQRTGGSDCCRKASGNAVCRKVFSRCCSIPETRLASLLVKHPLVKAVGFTGSLRGGRALMDVAAARPDPIPVFAEMSSTNPVFILPGALREKADAIAGGLHASFTIGAGQFCTKPGMVFLPDGVSDEPFIANLQKLVRESKQFNLLTRGNKVRLSGEHRAQEDGEGVTLLAERQRSGNDTRVCRQSIALRNRLRSVSEESGIGGRTVRPHDPVDPALQSRADYWTRRPS